MFGLAVFITVLLVGMIWFRSFQKNLYVLMNPEEDVGKMLAVENTPVPSLFGFILQTTRNIKGLVSELFNGNTNITNEHMDNTNNVGGRKVYKLPLSDYK